MSMHHMGHADWSCICLHTAIHLGQVIGICCIVHSQLQLLHLALQLSSLQHHNKTHASHVSQPATSIYHSSCAAHGLDASFRAFVVDRHISMRKTTGTHARPPACR